MTKPQTKMEQVDPLSRDTLQAFDDLFGVHPGFRPTHAKGILLSGSFTPSAGVAALTRAPHANRHSPCWHRCITSNARSFPSPKSPKRKMPISTPPSTD